ncbi:MFS transporter [Bacillus cereus]
MRFKDFHRNIKIRIIIALLSGSIGGMIFPFMAIYFVDNFGPRIAGILLLINVILGILVTFIGGYVADKFGRKKIILSVEFIRLIAFIIMAFCNSPWFKSALITFIMMSISGISTKLANPATNAMLIDVSTQAQRKYMYSIMYWINNLSIAIGGVIGALLFKEYLFHLLFFLSIITIFVVVMIAVFIEESYIPTASGYKSFRHIKGIFVNYGTVLQDRTFVLFVIAGAFLVSMEFQLTNYIGIRLSNEMATQQFLFWKIDGIRMMGLLRSENTIIVVLLMLIVTKITDQFNEKIILINSCLIYTICYGVISFSTNAWLLIIMMFIVTLAEVLRTPIEQSYMAAIPPQETRSSYIAFNGLKLNLSMLIASFTVILSSFLSPVVITAFITATGLVGALIFTLIIPSLEERKYRGNTENIKAIKKS